MANKKRKDPIYKVYDRKILRNMLKHQIGSNKIGQAWQYLRANNEKRRQINESKV